MRNSEELDRGRAGRTMNVLVSLVDDGCSRSTTHARGDERGNCAHSDNDLGSDHRECCCSCIEQEVLGKEVLKESCIRNGRY